MTNEFDDLASAYLDGQLTEIEAARVESDPELLAQVAELRTVAEALDAEVSPVDETLKRRQLSAAMAAFDQLDLQAGSADADADAAASGGSVVDLSERRAEATAARAEAVRPTGRAGLPNWLGVAAALLLVVGGIGFVAQVAGTGGDDAASDVVETAGAEADTAERTEGEAFELDEAMEDDEEAMEEDADAASSGLAAAPADGDDAEASEEADDGADESADDATEESAPPSTVPAQTSSSSPTTGGGLFPPESVEDARVFFGEIPDAEAVASLSQGELLAPSLSQCASDGSLDDGREVIGFIPVAVDEINGEVLFVELGPEPVAVVLTDGCTPFG